MNGGNDVRDWPFFINRRNRISDSFSDLPDRKLAGPSSLERAGPRSELQGTPDTRSHRTLHTRVQTQHNNSLAEYTTRVAAEGRRWVLLLNDLTTTDEADVIEARESGPHTAVASSTQAETPLCGRTKQQPRLRKTQPRG